MINDSHGDRGATDRAPAETLAGYLRQWELRTRIAGEIWALPEQPLPTAIADIVHGLIRDVLQEVERQASATTVSLALTMAAGGMRLTISDDGLGLAAHLYETRLRGRRVEVASVGGRLSINGVQGEGTTISVAVPLIAYM
ncbi:hypothetical protein [Nonomuraea sp. NPDC050783]|uniref:hypothetical protein n=1 Tax=Nonomuraea sp. NPDC050783 TaxID=3154634 RepID=UPI0034675480